MPIQPGAYKPWTVKKAQSWYNSNAWPIGCNYIPHNAVNQLEMWQEETFSPEIIHTELSWAAGLGFNTVRVFLHHLLWEQDSNGFLRRIDEFLTIASSHGIKTMFVLFDAVWDPYPKIGKQRDPVPHVHNSGWVQSPGYDVLNNADKYDELRHYVEGVVGYLKNDERVFVWDIFNEPDNQNVGSYRDDNYGRHKAELSLNLLVKAVTWVRTIQPIQPITMAPWQSDWSDPTTLSAIDDFMFRQSDIISFHCYENNEEIEKRIISLMRYRRPMLCTEYMARPLNSTFKNILPILKKYRVGGYNWGFVAGKSQTFCPWDSWNITPHNEPQDWFHDIFRPDGQPYCKDEFNYLVEFNNQPA